MKDKEKTIINKKISNSVEGVSTNLKFGKKPIEINT